MVFSVKLKLVSCAFLLIKVIAHTDDPVAFDESPIQLTEPLSTDIISFSKVDIVSPAQKMLATKLTCDIVPGKSLLVTG